MASEYQFRRPGGRTARSATDDRLWLKDYQKFEHTRLDRVQAAAQVWMGVFWAILLAGAIAPAPTDVIVIHGGQLTCGPVSAMQNDTSVTSVTPVTQC